MRALLPLTALALVCALTFAQAHHCAAWTSSTSNDRMTVVEGPFLFFDWLVVDHPCHPPIVEQRPSNVTVWFGHEFARVPLPVTVRGGCEAVAVWMYFEANGIPGLQRADDVHDDTCHWSIEPDYFVW